MVYFVNLSRIFMKNYCKIKNFTTKIHVINYIKSQKCIDYKQFLTTKSKNSDLCIESLKNHMLSKLISRRTFFILVTKDLKNAPKFIKSNSLCIFKSCIAQFEYVLAYRIRRGQQLISLYTKLWDEMALKRIFQQLKKLTYRRSKEFLLCGATFAFDWNSQNISEDELRSHSKELDICRLLMAKKIKDICPCSSDEECEACAANWSPFIEQEDLTVWKKEEKNYRGLYSYKMYGKYLDVTAKDFLTVFLDIDHRTEWDEHVVQLKLIESEPSINSDIIYWETKWPKLFSNRDYVFVRRYLVDESQKMMVVMNRSTVHPDYPAVRSKSRVSEYWSYIVIKPTSEFNQPGIEFSLTYFDNPGISVPSAISLWVSSQGMPSYIKRLRVEALKASEIRKKNEEMLKEQLSKQKQELKTIKEKEFKDKLEEKEKIKIKLKEKDQGPPKQDTGKGDEIVKQPSIIPNGTDKNGTVVPDKVDDNEKDICEEEEEESIIKSDQAERPEEKVEPPKPPPSTPPPSSPPPSGDDNDPNIKKDECDNDVQPAIKKVTGETGNGHHKKTSIESILIWLSFMWSYNLNLSRYHFGLQINLNRYFLRREFKIVNFPDDA